MIFLESSWDETTCKETLKRLSVKSAGRAKPCKRHDYFQFGTYLTGHLKLPAGKRRYKSEYLLQLCLKLISLFRMICKICNFECLALSMRLHHTRQHPNGGIKPPKPKKPQPITNTGEIFVCEVSGCNRDFKLLHRLKKHRLREHPNIEKIPCHLCELFFTSQAQLDKHLIEGHKKKPGRDRGAKYES